jgi:integrase
MGSVERGALAAFAELRQRLDRLGRPQESLIFSVESPSNWFDSAVARTAIEGLAWHTLRHTFASRLAMNRVNLKTIQVLLGHKTITMTARYAHLAARHLKAAVELIVPSWWKKVQRGQLLASRYLGAGGERRI